MATIKTRLSKAGDFRLWTPTKILVGKGKVRDLGQELSLDRDFSGKSRCMVVTDLGVKQAGLLDYLLESLKASHQKVVAVSDSSLAEAGSERIDEMVRLAKEADPDFWIALGGGSAMACCKVAAVLESNGGNLEHYTGRNPIRKESKPVICIPTTAGTGSEASWRAFIIDGKKRERRVKIISDHCLIPNLAILDSELTRTLPAHLVAITGLYSLCNALTALTSKQRQEMSTAMSLGAIEIIVNNLPEAFRNNSTNPEVREKMLTAAIMAGVALQAIPLGVEHVIGNAATSLSEMRHGLAVSIASLHVLENSMKALAPIHAKLARALGIRDDESSDMAMGKKAMERLKEFYTELGVGLTYKEYGYSVDDNSVEQLIARSLDADHTAPVPSEINRTPQFENLVRSCIGL